MLETEAIVATITPGRMTHRYDGELVVFLIGMRVNRWWRPDLWLPAFLAMPRMLRELSTTPDSGFLGYRLLAGANGPYVVQYWSSHEHLYAYASDASGEHRPAWAAFNRRARRAPGAVGIWHETFQVERAETLYVGMPAFGLAAATERVPVGSHADRARQRYAQGRTRAPGADAGAEPAPVG
ncbi:DUF4188 domain-containing protein [Agromyces sp. SYSU T00194]|uniref:DUF4188 domain-containing protein n=1 Tax=Agromyces chitinivorans TaxID=3158560 RepID=UPI00339285E1